MDIEAWGGCMPWVFIRRSNHEMSMSAPMLIQENSDKTYARAVALSAVWAVWVHVRSRGSESEVCGVWSGKYFNG